MLVTKRQKFLFESVSIGTGIAVGILLMLWLDSKSSKTECGFINPKQVVLIESYPDFTIKTNKAIYEMIK